MTSTARAGIVFVIVALFAGGATAALYLREKEEEAAAGKDADAAADASADAHAKIAKGKATGNKKRAVRGGKTTKVAPRPAAPVAPTTKAEHAGGGGGGGGTPSHVPDEGNDPPDHGGGGLAPPPRVHRHYTASGPSYESAIDSNNQQLNMGGSHGPDLTDAQLSAPMSDGTFIGDCDAPDDMGITVKVAIKNGRAVGVTVITSPRDKDVAGCIDHHVRGLSWPSSPKMDSFVTTY